MPTTKEITVYKFSELSESVKKKVLDKYREHVEFFYDFVIDDAEAILGMFGFSNVKIEFSGFWNQGDGACFTGVFNSEDFKFEKVVEYAPQDKEIVRIAEGFKSVCSEYSSVKFSLYKISHHYSHHNTIGITDVDFCDLKTGIGIGIDDFFNDKQVKDWKYLQKLSQDLMQWVYKRLEEEYEYQTSDEQILEQLNDGGQEYLEDGSAARF